MVKQECSLNNVGTLFCLEYNIHKQLIQKSPELIIKQGIIMAKDRPKRETKKPKKAK
jgi:hypothetical protein